MLDDKLYGQSVERCNQSAMTLLSRNHPREVHLTGSPLIVGEIVCEKPVDTGADLQQVHIVVTHAVHF